MDIKKSYIIIFFLLMVQLLLYFYFSSKIDKLKNEYIYKQETVLNLKMLERRWSPKSQQNELKRIYELLDAFGIKYKKRELNGKKVLIMTIKTEDVDKILTFILNRNIDYKKISIDKIDSYSIKLVVKI